MQGAAIFRCPLIATALFHALCGAQRSSASLPTDGAERALDFSMTMRYNSGTRTPRSRYHIIEKTGKTPTKYKGITRYTTFVKFHRTVVFRWVRFPACSKKGHHPMGGVLFWSRVRESNPPSRLGKPLYYRYTNPALWGHYSRQHMKNQAHFVTGKFRFIKLPFRCVVGEGH